MVIVGLDPYIVTGKVWETSKTIGDAPRDLSYTKQDRVILDPGGWYYAKIPWLEFEVNGYNFEVQPHNALQVAHHVGCGKQRLPSIIRFGLWNWHYYLPLGLCVDLYNKLLEIDKSDAAIHAQIDWDEAWRKLQS